MGLIGKVKAMPSLIASTFARLQGKKLKVLSIECSIKSIIERNLSVVRYGDGEIRVMCGKECSSFQVNNNELSNRLKQIAKSDQPNVMICVSNIFEGVEHFTDDAREFYRFFNSFNYHSWFKFFDRNRVYGNTFLTRPYMDLQDKSPAAGYFELLKQIWAGRDIVIIEGEFSRLGVGNDLFYGAKSIERILCPAKNAFLRYDDILTEAKKIDNNKLILIALGATATVLAYDLAMDGYQAIDIGHVDVEYEWMLMGAITKVPIASKYVNEAGAAGQDVRGDLIDEIYNSQIIARML